MQERSPLNATEKQIVRKLATARFPPATASKRFARDLSSGHVKELSDRGRAFLAFVAHRFRRQYRLNEEESEWVEKHMPHHFQKSIDEAMEFCKQCNRLTRHRVSAGRLAHCLEHGPKVNELGESKKQEKARERRERESQNPRLF